MISHFLFVISTHLLYVRLLSRTRVWYCSVVETRLHVGQIGRNKSKLLWKVGLLNFILYEFHVTSRLFLLLMDTLQLEPTRGATQGNISFRCNFSCFSPFNDQSNFYYMMRIEWIFCNVSWCINIKRMISILAG